MKKSTDNYFLQRDTENILKTRELMKDLPPFCKAYFVGVENVTSALTRLNYARDLKIFFYYLLAETDIYADENKTIKTFEVSDLDKVSATNIEEFISFLSNYEYDGKIYSNNEAGKSRKLSTIRAFFKYFFNKGLLKSDNASKVKMPKKHEKDIIRLEPDEVAKLLRESETGIGLTSKQQSYHLKTSVRDTAILTVLLGTGMRVSEFVGLNLDDVDFESNGLKITRKGGNQVVLYFGDEVCSALISWLKERTRQQVPQEEKALFVSLQNTRFTPRAIQKLVKKYSSLSTPLKHITPHKLRSTYGTSLYRETQDIYIVADVLGHKDVNTTKKHYAAISEDLRKSVANKVKLRDE